MSGEGENLGRAACGPRGRVGAAAGAQVREGGYLLGGWGGAVEREKLCGSGVARVWVYSWRDFGVRGGGCGESPRYALVCWAEGSAEVCDLEVGGFIPGFKKRSGAGNQPCWKAE